MLDASSRLDLRIRSGRDKNDRLLEIGERIGSFADIARDCDPMVLAMFSTDQVEDVVERGLQRVFQPSARFQKLK
jgi:hypothetical protein